MKKSLIKIATLAVVLGVSGVSQAEVVTVVSAKSDVATMTADQVSQVFLGKSTAMTPVEQSENSPVRAEFYKKVLDKEVSQVKAIWSKLLFTGKATPPKEVGGSAEVKKAVAADPKAIGYIEKSAVDATVKVVLTSP